MDHVVNSCPLTKSEGGLTILLEAEDDAVNWLNSVATTVHTHSRLMALFPGLSGRASTRKTLKY